MTDLNAEFFKLIGWEVQQSHDKVWGIPHWVDSLGIFQAGEGGLPNVAGDWQVFHDRVVPELVKSLKGSGREYRDNFDRVAEDVGTHFMCDKTPQQALEWAMEELGI